jgi:hypothetical protein
VAWCSSQGTTPSCTPTASTNERTIPCPWWGATPPICTRSRSPR